MARAPSAMAAAPEAQASDTVTAGPCAPKRRASRRRHRRRRHRRWHRGGAPARRASAANARVVEARRSPPAAARASATTVANDDRPDSAPRNTPSRAGSTSTRGPPPPGLLRRGQRAAASADLRGRASSLAIAAARGGTAAATVQGKPCDVEAGHRGDRALAPPPAAASDAGQLGPSGVTAPTPRTNTDVAAPAMAPLTRAAVASMLPGSQMFSTSRRRAISFGCFTSRERERQLRLRGQLAVDLGRRPHLPAVLAARAGRGASSSSLSPGRTIRRNLARSIDDQQRVQIVAAALAHGRLAQHAAQLRQRLEDQRARASPGGRESGRRRCRRTGHALDSRAPAPAAERRDPVEEDVAHAMRTLPPGPITAWDCRR